MGANSPDDPTSPGVEALSRAFDWPASSDPNDETFGDVVTATALDDAGEFDAVLVGEPYDGAVIGRRGAREGPRAIRRELAGTKTHHFDAGPVRSVGDLGDLDLGGDDPADGTDPDGPGVAATQSTVREVGTRVHETDAFPVFLGGDNSLSFPNCAPLLDGHGSVGAINFDAHLDVREPVDGPSSGTPYRQLLEAGLDDLAVVGARHFETSTAYHDYLREHGGEVVTAEEVGDDPVAAADAALNALGTDRVYVSVDLDVVDAAAAPGVSAPTPGGIAPRELFRALRLVAESDRVVGFEVVECAPGLEPGSTGSGPGSGDGDGGPGGFRTARVAARAVAHVLAARQRSSRGHQGGSQ